MLDIEAIKRLHETATKDLKRGSNSVEDFRAQHEAQQVLYLYSVRELLEEVIKLRGVIAQHDLCHDLHGKVGALDFAKGCEAEQRKLYGCAPHADQVTLLQEILKKCRDLLEAINDEGGLYSKEADLLLIEVQGVLTSP